MAKHFYVYQHINLDTGLPFYIGVGTNKLNRRLYQRAYRKHERNHLWDEIFSKHKYKVEILEESDDRDFILQKEKEYIKLYGSYKNGGILCNIKDGGERTALNFTKVISEEHKLAISKANSNRKKSRETIELHRTKMIGKKASEETKQKMSIAQTNRKFSEETKLKISNAKKGVKQKETFHSANRKVINILTGIIYKSMTKAAQDNGLSPSTLKRRIVKGVYKNLQLLNEYKLNKTK